MVAKKNVDVALVVVAFQPVKFWRVEDPVRRRLDRDVRPPITSRVVPTVSDPVKFAADEMV